MPCPVPTPPNDPFAPPKKGWRKKYMIDLNLLTSEGDWEKKLDGLHPDALGPLLRTLRAKRLIP